MSWSKRKCEVRHWAITPGPPKVIRDKKEKPPRPKRTKEDYAPATGLYVREIDGKRICLFYNSGEPFHGQHK